MRDYLYLWHDAAARSLVVSGLEFRDLVPQLTSGGGILLIDHQADHAERDTRSSFDYVTAPGLARLATENIHRWGNFAWVDYATPALATLPDEDIAALLFFAHKGRPLGASSFASLGNRFLA